MEILVAYGSSYGSTRGIVERIAALLQSAGHDVTLRRGRDVKSLDGFEGVVLGSGVYAGRLHGEIRSLLAKQRAALASKRIAAVVVSLSAAEQSERAQAETIKYLKLITDVVAVERSASFAGAWDPANAPWLVRLVMKKLGTQPGDRRDWPAIEAWAAELAKAWLEPK